MTEIADRNPHVPALPEETRAAASAYIVRTQDDPGELLMALGLAADPVAEANSRRKAAASLHGGTGHERPLCEVCGNAVPPHGVCRRAAGCRAEARKAGGDR